ncbi:TD and POZ domain-containing protein 5 [Caerostris darwini]|uniref:TD and POZ domain-containing protein 5 n=1 Tax=Caerostris darwini TaxID=1538125 RepID=A0AAV4Q362_9ARAC|nr:TD and POZ domain-containing protein 5 [Caerostris darwini]
MWRTDGLALKGEQIIARTVVEIERRSFIWDIKYLSSNQIFEQNPLSVTFLSKNAVLNLSSFLKKRRQSVEEKFTVQITSAVENIKYFTFHCDLLDSLGNKLDCGEEEFWWPNLEMGEIFKLPYTYKKLIEERDKYLPKDVLSLQCDCVISTGIAYQRIESFTTGMDTYTICKHDVESNESGISPDLKADLKSLFTEGILSDTKIRTSTETFPAHTQIVGARSPVFKAMFSTDMKERTKELIPYFDTRLIPYFDTRLIPYFDTRLIPYFDTRLIPYFDTRLIPYFDTRLIPYFDTRLISYFDTRLIPYFDTRLIPYFDTRLIPYFDTRLISYFDTRLIQLV